MDIDANITQATNSRDELDASTVTVTVDFIINGKHVYHEGVDARLTAADFIRDHLQLHGTRLGCEHGVCGACTILVGGASVRSCTMFAAQLSGTTVTTVEGLEDRPGQLHPIQSAFIRHHGLQCGFCTSGILMVSHELLSEEHDVDEERVREHISGNLCRCTGYQGIVDAVLDADNTWDCLK